MIDQLENCIKSSSKDYIHYWVNLFNELTQQKDVIQSQLKDIQLYGKQLSKNKKANLKILFKNLNNSLDQISKVHEGLVIYHDRILTNIKTELRDKIIPIYNQIYSGFIDVPFSKNNKKYVKISNEDFTKLIEKLF
ncbi:hypothetical protein HZS_1207 [Henneguya salminicola]|nr:hypothetical protein HZS_1207 [Henneguya salminicola]